MAVCVNFGNGLNLHRFFLNIFLKNGIYYVSARIIHYVNCVWNAYLDNRPFVKTAWKSCEQRLMSSLFSGRVMELSTSQPVSAATELVRTYGW